MRGGEGVAGVGVAAGGEGGVARGHGCGGHGEFRDLVATGKLRHFDQAGLTAAVRGAAERPLSGAVALERRVAADQSPLTASEFAVWAFTRWEELSRPGVWVI